jgi:hypothetical protein
MTGQVGVELRRQLIFSVVMIASFVQVFIEAFQRAIGPADKVPFDLSFVGAM